MLLAFGTSGNPWLLPTYEPLAEEFDVRCLSSRPLDSPIARRVWTSRSLLGVLPASLRAMVGYGLDALTEDWDRILGLRRHLQGCDLVNTVEITGGVSHQVARMRTVGKFRHVVSVWQNLPRRRLSNPWMRRVRRDVLRSADHFVTITERACTALILDGIPAEKITVAGAGVQPPAATERSDPRQDALRLLFVGKKLRSKGVQELLFALRLLLDDPEAAGVEVELEFLGVEPSRRGYAPLIRELELGGMIREVPFVPHAQVSEHYRDADALVVPSRVTPLWQEQWGMVFMEAMSHGLPIVTTASGSISEVVGDAGLYARPNDHHSLYLRLKELALEPSLRGRLSRNGLDRVARELTTSKAAERLAVVFRHLLREDAE